MSETETARHTLLQSCAAARLGTSARLGTIQPSSHVVGKLSVFPTFVIAEGVWGSKSPQ